MSIREKLSKFFKARDVRLNQMSEMLHTTGAGQGLERGLCGEGELRSMLGRCLWCESAKECQHWLANAKEQSPAPGFCPNAAQMERLRMS